MSRKIRILHVLKSSIYSGAENIVISIIKQLGKNFDLLYLASEGSIRERLDEEKISFVLLEKFNRISLEYVLREYRPDIVHAHDFTATVICASLKGDFRLISHLHYDPPWVNRWNAKTFVYSIFWKRIERVLVVSENMFQNMIFKEKFKDKMIVVGNPIDVENIKQKANLKLLKDKEYCDLIFVGRLVYQKNPQRFIQLVASLKENGWNSISAWILGDGELYFDCKELIDRLDLHENIKMRGFQDNPYPYIKHASIACITSRWEGFGLVAIEASMLGVPVLTTPNSGCREIFGEGAPEICDSDEMFIEKILFLRNSLEEYRIWHDRSLEHSMRFNNMERYMGLLSCIYRNEV